MSFSYLAKVSLCRLYQAAALVPMVLFPEKERAILKGTGCTKKLPVYIRKKNIDKVMVVTDAVIRKSGLLLPMYEKLIENNIACSEYSDVGTNPTCLMAERCAQRYIQEGCSAIIAVGSGSVMDCAKLAGIIVSGRKTNIASLRGYKPFMRKLPPLFAVPTTVGTGGESCAYAVCFDKKNKKRNIIRSHVLRPDAAVLDPVMTETLPNGIMAQTALSALCRAVEVYIGTCATEESREKAMLAVRLVFGNIEKACRNNDNDARMELQKAAYLTGGNAGYAHHCALAMSAVYRIPYAEAAAVMLPAVLRTYGEKAYKRLACLADCVKIKGGNDAEKAEAFIAALEKLNSSFMIPSKLKALKKSGIPGIAKETASVCNPSYSAPRQLFYDDICNLLIKIKG